MGGGSATSTNEHADDVEAGVITGLGSEDGATGEGTKVGCSDLLG